MSKQVKPCPRCKAILGWFENRVLYGDQFFDADGSASHFSDKGVSRGGRRKYCYECERDITTCVLNEEPQ